MRYGSTVIPMINGSQCDTGTFLQKLELMLIFGTPMTFLQQISWKTGQIITAHTILKLREEKKGTRAVHSHKTQSFFTVTIQGFVPVFKCKKQLSISNHIPTSITPP
jgi:hypothetical protein